jgi:2,3-bisphosphoglycerate-independent phosphoglycerate mutase
MPLNMLKKYQSNLHIFGLVSDGGVHSYTTHIKALDDLAKSKGLERVYFHAFMDGRDTPPTSGLEYLNRLTLSWCENCDCFWSLLCNG